jgi:hypothetical protein
VSQPDSPRLAELRRGIAKRLRRICGPMPDAEFDDMVARIAEIEYKYEKGDRFRNPTSLPPGT